MLTMHPPPALSLLFTVGGMICVTQAHSLVITQMPAKHGLSPRSNTYPEQELFMGSEVSITSQGRPYLGAALGSDEFCEQYITKNVSQWKEELVLLAKIATTQPHASFAAFIHGFIHKFTYFARTNPNICSLLQPLEDTIRSQLIPAWTGKAPLSDLECDLFALPARLWRIRHSQSSHPLFQRIPCFSINLNPTAQCN